MSKSKRFDVKATNPRYRGAKMSDVARALLRPKSPAARAELDRVQGRSGTSEKAAEEPLPVKPSL